MSDFVSFAFGKAQAEIEQALEHYLCPTLPESLWQAMSYSVLGGGKRLRPILCLFTAEALISTWHDAIPAACALELIHVYSLIHDDLPALDNDDWRRGRLSNHKVHGEAMAILAGDALQSYAFQLLTDMPLKPEIVLACLRDLSHAAGPAGMCAGQVIDMQASLDNPQQVLQMYRLKTGALIRASVRMGAHIGQATDEQLEALTRYAEYLGEAFQLVDDLLDLSGSLASLGKTPGKDIAQSKRTFVALCGEQASRERIQLNLEQALIALREARLVDSQRLEALAYSLVERSS